MLPVGFKPGEAEVIYAEFYNIVLAETYFYNEGRLGGSLLAEADKILSIGELLVSLELNCGIDLLLFKILS